MDETIGQTPLSLLRQQFAAAATAIAPDADEAAMAAMVKPSADAKFGDYQANMAMPLAKRLGRPPREVAADLVAAVDLGDLCEPPEIAGPGFINLTLRESYLTGRVREVDADHDRVIPQAPTRLRVIVDFSSPNVAKPMHVGHLRSTVIGDSLQRIYRALGHDVTSDNHVGDWGTQFGMILLGFKNFCDDYAYTADPVGELARLYRVVNQIIAYQAAVNAIPELEVASEEAAQRSGVAGAAAKSAAADDRKKAAKAAKRARSEADAAAAAVAAAKNTVATVQADEVLLALADETPNAADQARRETALLHAGDERNVALWNDFMPRCMEALQDVYDRLGVVFDETLGESHYNPMLADTVARLEAADVAEASDGATVVHVAGRDAPLIVRKSDGAFTYGTTDLATVADRVERLDADRVLYVVDERQSEHFKLLFAVAERLGYEADLRHVAFGTVLGEDGRPYKTRSGDAVGLESLLDEAVSAAREIVAANDEAKPSGAELGEAERDRVAEVVGLGGIKYADLKHNRESDYRFSYNKMLAKTGNTATYMQYAYARTRGILRKAGVESGELPSGEIALTEPAERALALRILRFGEALEGVIEDHRPNILTEYLFDLAGAFSTFFEECPVVKADDTAVRASRLRLTDLTGQTIRRGLGLLGIEVCERM